MKRHLLLFVIAMASYSCLLSQNADSKTITTDSLKVKSIYDEANRYLDIHTDTARIYAYKGINLSKTLNLTKGVGDGYFYTALSYDIDNQLDSGIFYYKKSLQIYKTLHASKSCAVTSSNLGELYFKKGKIDEAYSFYNESLHFFETIKLKEGIARNYFNIGIIFKVNGNYQVAIEYFFRALKASESIHDTIKITINFQEIGNLYSRQKNYAKAIYYFEEGLKFLKNSRSKYLINITAHLKTNLGKTYEDSGSYDKANINYNEAFSIYESIKNKSGMATVLMNLGELNNKRHKYDEALRYNTKSLELFKQLNNHNLLAYGIYNRGSIYRGLQLYDKSFKLFHEALEKAKKNKDKSLTKSIAEEMSLTYETIGDYERAHKYYKLYKTLNDSLFNDETTRRITTIELQYQFDKKQKSLAFAQQEKEMKYEAKINRQKLLVKAIIISSSLLILLSFTGFGYYRSRQVAKFRALEIELSRSIQQALSQQMNPHFIFNCLNSIKALILDNNIEETEKYFGIFASLMRKNLEYSQSSAIPINDEIETLKLYVQLEQLRFKNKFDFKANIDSAIDQFTCKIPSLLLQPFVENAILHGFRNKDQGNIVVGMTLSKNEILCSIEDDGVGRLPETENRTNKTHKSYGTMLTKKRLELIYQLYGNAKGLNITDKKSQAGTPSGTCIEFGIPIII